MYADELSGTVPVAGVSWKRCKAQRGGLYSRSVRVAR